MKSLDNLKKRLRPGQVYRRADLEKWSKSVDRDLAKLVENGTLAKVSRGLYAFPKMSRFGELPPQPEKLVKAFLKDDDFLLTSPNDYNSLGLGTTQLYNVQIVYNHKRHGRFELEGQVFDFKMKARFPKKATTEFLLVELVNNLKNLAEDHEKLLQRVRVKAPQMNTRRLATAVKKFAKVSTRKVFEEALSCDSR
ncbi:MAG: DUF6088 family protein [Desulfuromonadales bacterium]|nr:DUF6088 family protein [Desulfuromonadales bacterium]MDH3870027.1 DUF6088 family protein [Desulfuromonadales bacterium]MDH3961550.1 DUF6088 family protein [Desulfuromonadales bacterium]MDH4025881.1 DUF6088 family protein [Desulfuromonadales bacterium]